MTEQVLLNQGDAGPESRVVVTYEHAGNRCVLPARMVGYERDGTLCVEVERQDQRTGIVFSRKLKRIPAEELVSVEEAS